MPFQTVAARIARMPRAQRRRILAWTLGALAVLLLLMSMDATWWRPVIQHYVVHRSGRQVAFEEMNVGLGRTGDLVVTWRGLHVQNAPWAGPQPLVAAAEMTVQFPWRSLWTEQFVITRLRLVDAQVDLERRSDGLRNWRLTRPEDRGPGRVRVQAVSALRTQARIVDGSSELALELASQPISGPSAALKDMPFGKGAASAPPLAHQVSLRGSRRGVAFTGQVKVSDWVTLMGTAEQFSLQGELVLPQARLSAQGLAGDLVVDATYQGQWTFEGRGVGELAAVLGPGGGLPQQALALPARASAALDKQGRQWRLTSLKASLGRSDLAGELIFEQPPAQPPDEASKPAAPRLQGSLSSERLDTAELRRALSGGERAAAATAAGLQADVDWQVRLLSGLPPAEWTSVSTHVAVRGRRTTLSPLSFSVWGGPATGRISIDASTPPLTLAADLQTPGLPLSQLAGGSLAGQGVSGDLALNIRLSSRGDTAQDLAAAVEGEVTGTLRRTTLPAALEAKVGLDGGRWLRSLLGGDQRLAVSCSALGLQFKQGIGQVQQLALETPHLALSGKGQVNLPARRFELWLAPRRKQAALLALDRWLHLRGGPGRLEVATVAPSGALPASTCTPPGGG